MKIGVIADDFTGATDIASYFAKSGLSVLQVNTGALTDINHEGYHVIVFALKSRSCPVEEAIAISVTALKQLKEAGCDKIFFKYCSTFDSTSEGNISAVTSALMDELKTEQTLFCPGLPKNGRTVYMGYLFVDGTLLSDSPMRFHPLNPMTESDLVQLITNQTAGNRFTDIHKVLANDLETGRVQLSGNLLVDCISDKHLEIIADKFTLNDDYPLITGSSGLAEYVGYILSRQETLTCNEINFKKNEGPMLMLAGSCSAMTKKQIQYFCRSFPGFHIDIKELRRSGVATYAGKLLTDAMHSEPAAILIYSADLSDRENGRAEHDSSVSQDIENLFAEIGKQAVDRGIANIIVAGGETSGAVVSALGLDCFEIGQQICEGVPFVRTTDDRKLLLALKSGNFGKESFFNDAMELSQ